MDRAEPRRPWQWAGRLLACVAAWLAAGCVHFPAAPRAPALAIVGATVLPAPDAVPIADGIVVVRGGRIAQVGPRSQVHVPADAVAVPAAGLFLVAGFQNSHVHFTEPRWDDAAAQDAEGLARELDAFALRWGFTTVVDVGSYLPNTLALRARIEGGGLPGPRILTAGVPLYPVNGIPYYLREVLPPGLVAQLPTPATPEDAAKAAAVQLDAGADAVKLFTGAGLGRGRVRVMPPEVGRGAAAEAHRRAKPVFAHAGNAAGLEAAIASGVDVLAHALDDPAGWSESQLARMVERGMALVPTLELFGALAHIGTIQRQVGAFAAAGGQVLFGTDAGYKPDADPAAEYALMAGAGMDWRAILASLTTAPAARFGEAHRRGRVAAGMDADLVLLAADPRADVRAFARVRQVLRGGRVVHPRARP